MKRFSFLPILAACGILSASAAFAQKTITPDIPKTISYQGLLSNSDGSQISDGNHRVTVTLYADQFGSEPIWSDTYETTTIGGVFNLYLGSNQPLPGSAEMNRPLWIGTAVNGGQEMRPLTPMSSSPYALNLPDGAVSNAKLADGAVTAEKVDMDYVSSISVNGQKITAKGGELNLRSSDDIRISYDEVSNSLSISKATTSDATTGSEKDGAKVLTGGVGNWVGINNSNFNHDPAGVGSSNYNTIAGGRFNSNGQLSPAIWVDASTISGGINNRITGSEAAIGGGESNTAQADNATIGGGTTNDVQAPTGTIGGGESNTILPSVNMSIVYTGTTIGGGTANTALSGNNTIGGGRDNDINFIIVEPYYPMPLESTIGGGGDNEIILSGWSTISGGEENMIYKAAEFAVHGYSSSHSTIAGGYNNHIEYSINSAIGGGADNVITGFEPLTLITEGSDYSVIGGGSDNTIGTDEIASVYNVIDGGYLSTIEGQYSAIGGGSTNRILDAGSEYGTIGGGVNNTIAASGTPANVATIGGGSMNSALAVNATVSGGKENTASGGSSTVGGGIYNAAGGVGSTVAGGQSNLATADVATIGGGSNNTANTAAQFSTIAGGISNTIMAGRYAGTIGGGSGNIVDGTYATVSGGRDNQAGSPHSYVGAGRNNIAGSSVDFASYATIAGGSGNQIYSDYAGIVSGLSNLIEDGNPHSFIGGGRENIIYASTDPDIISSVIAGGRYNKVQAEAGASSIGGGSGNQIIPDAGIPNPNYLHATIPGGDNLIAQSWAQTVVGGYNLPKGSVSSRVVFGGDRNDPVLIVGSGFDAGGGMMQRFNAFEVSYNGHSVVYHKNGTGAATPAIRGATYTDNVIYAWGQATPSLEGVTVDCDFGVASIVRLNAGEYRVTMNLVEPLDDGTFAPMNITCGSVTATIVHGSRVCAFINTSPITNMPGGPSYFDVYVSDPTGCVGTDEYPFTFKVTGCPAESQ